jgi:hypothetical protein
MSALLAKAQDAMKGKPHSSECEGFINHLIEAFTTMKTKITKDVRNTLHSLVLTHLVKRTHQASEASRTVLAKVAAKLFKQTDDTDRAGEATADTAKDFCKSAVM